MNKAELLRRTNTFALLALKVVDDLPKSLGGRTVGNQLLRSATSVGADYRAACRARSRAEFVAKLGIVAAEADESLSWLELINEGGLLRDSKVSELIREADELTAIFTSARRTSTRNQTSKIKPQTSAS